MFCGILKFCLDQRFGGKCFQSIAIVLQDFRKRVVCNEILISDPGTETSLISFC